MATSARCTEIRRYKWAFFYAAAFLGFLAFCVLAAAIAGANTPLNSSLPDESVAVLAGRRAMYSASTVFTASSHQVHTSNGNKEVEASSWNYTIYFGLSALGTYYSAEFDESEAYSVFSYSQYMPCEWRNDTQPAVVYLAKGDGRRRMRRLDTTGDAIGNLNKFNPCTTHIAEACEIEYMSTYGHFVAAFVFTIVAIILQIIRGWKRCSMDNYRYFCGTCLAWLLVCCLSAAGVGNFYERCVSQTTTFLTELIFDTFHAELNTRYGPLTNCSVAASAFSGVCLVINLTFYYIGPTDFRRSMVSKPSDNPSENGRRVTIGAITMGPDVGDTETENNPKEVGEDMNHGDIYANSGKF
jgi:hypothetical protein